MAEYLLEVIKNKKINVFILSYFSFFSICNLANLNSYNMISIMIFIAIYFLVYNVNLNNDYKKELIVLSGVLSFIIICGNILYSLRYSPTIVFLTQLLKVSNAIYLLGNGIL